MVAVVPDSLFSIFSIRLMRGADHSFDLRYSDFGAI